MQDKNSSRTIAESRIAAVYREENVGDGQVNWLGRLNSAPVAGLAGLLFLTVAVVVPAYYGTLASIVRIWANNEAYRHGFTIIPITLLLVWLRRDALFDVKWGSSLPGVALILVCSLLWWVGDLVGLQVVMQIATILLFPSAVIAIAGFRVAHSIAFPLCFLLFSVPFGEALIPFLTDFTASFSVSVLNTLGIPVYRDGRYFHIPTGSYEIAKACAGLMYVIATLTIATLYSYFLFENKRKAILFVGFAVVLSVIANAIRATVVVLVLHYTEFDISAGRDHEFVGWIIYALLTVLLVLVGRRFQDVSPSAIGKSQPPECDPANGIRPTNGAIVRIGCLVVAAITLGPVLSVIADKSLQNSDFVSAGLPSGFDEWDSGVPGNVDWRPAFLGYDEIYVGEYAQRSHTVQVALVRYFGQKQGSEITDAANSVLDTSVWTLSNIKQTSVVLGEAMPVEFNEVVATKPGQPPRLVWWFVQVNGEHVSGVLETKFKEARHKMFGNAISSSALVLSTTLVSTELAGRQLLVQFLLSNYEQMQNCIDGMQSNFGCTVGISQSEEV